MVKVFSVYRAARSELIVTVAATACRLNASHRGNASPIRQPHHIEDNRKTTPPRMRSSQRRPTKRLMTCKKPAIAVIIERTTWLKGTQLMKPYKFSTILACGMIATAMLVTIGTWSVLAQKDAAEKPAEKPAAEPANEPCRRTCERTCGKACRRTCERRA